MADSRRFGLDEVVAYFQELEDPRSEINRKHPLASVVEIDLIAVLADGDRGVGKGGGGGKRGRSTFSGVFQCPRSPIFPLFPRAFLSFGPAWVMVANARPQSRRGWPAPPCSRRGRTARSPSGSGLRLPRAGSGVAAG